MCLNKTCDYESFICSKSSEKDNRTEKFSTTIVKILTALKQ